MVATDLFFSEYVEGSSLNKALEIANFTGDIVDLSQYTVEIYFNGSLTPATTLTLAGMLADGDVFVLADDGSDAAILAVADLTPGNNFFNGDDAIALRKSGVLIDVFGQIGVDPGTSWPGGGADVTLRRLPSVIAGDPDGSDPFDSALEWESFPNNTFDGLGSHTIDGGNNGGTPQALVINEFVFNHVGIDTNEYAEIFGSPNTDYSRYTLLQIEGDNGSVLGRVTTAQAIGTTDANGFWTTGFLNNAYQNGTQTLLLVEDFTGSLNQDLDTNDDGILDITPWGRIVDDVAVSDGGNGDLTYSSTVLAPGFGGDTFTPGGASRIPDGQDTDTAADWVRNDFDLAGIPGFTGTPVVGEALNTPGAANAVVVAPPPPVVVTPIYDIQGAGHISPLVGQAVTTTGIVTAVDTNGFYLQDPTGDGNIATSDAIFVFTGSAPTVAVGNAIQISGTVSEFTPGGAATRNLSTTQLSGSLTIEILGMGNSLPAATLIGAGGRVPPTENIDDDAFGSFDPETDGIDFFESLEGMRVTAQDLRVVNGTNRFGEIFGVVDNGAGATGLSDRGTLNISPDDFNPERVQVQFDDGVFDFAFPDVNVGDNLGNVTGVVGYGFGNFEIVVTEDFTDQIQSAELQPEVSTLTRGDDQLTVATYNVLNLDPNDSDGDADVADGRFDAIARQIVDNLNTPDIIALQEVQDNTGSTNDGVTAADVTLQTLVDAIAAAGGPTYAFIDNTFIIDGQSGGQPGANIRTAYLYDPSRVDLVEGSVATIGGQGSGEAFQGARLPLVATFDFNGEAVTLVNNHFSSKGGSAPILGTAQPFEARQEDVTVNGSLDERQAQSQAVQGYVSGLLGNDPTANVVVLGDLNEFEFVSPVIGLESAGLTNLTNTLPEDERYSFIFQGNSQSLDHILVSDSLAATAEYDAVHVNAEFANALQASDHDPLLARFTLTPAFNVIAGTGQRDVLIGTDGRDRIFASRGPDVITTGGDRDQIVYTHTNQTGDTLTDFEVGADQLVFTDLLASIGYQGTNPLADGTIQFRNLGNSGRTQLSLELDRMGCGRTQFTNFITFQGVDAAALNNAENFVF